MYDGHIPYIGITMGKNIVVITGSPRRGANTDTLVNAFIKGAVASGNNVTKFDAAGSGVKGCIACGRCYSGNVACPNDGAFSEFAPSLEGADIVVIATPLYWFTFSSQIKAVIDKFHALMHKRREKIKNKDTMLFCVAETDEDVDFEGIIRTYELMNAYLEWNEIGRIIVPDLHSSEDILKTDALEKVEKLGKGI